MDANTEKSTRKFNKKHFFWIIPATVLSIALLLFLLYPVFVKSYIKKKITHWGQIHSVNIGYDNITFKGYKNLGFSNLFIISSEYRDTLFFANAINAEIGYGKTGVMKPYLSALHTDQVFLKMDFPHSETDSLPDELAPANSAKLSGQLKDVLRLFHHYFPEKLDVNRVLISMPFENQYFEYRIDTLCVAGELLSGKITANEGGTLSQWNLLGNISLDRAKLDVHLTGGQVGAKTQPILLCKKYGNMDLALGELSFSCHLLKDESEKMEYRVHAEMKKLSLFQPALVEQEIKIDNLSWQGLVELTANHFRIDSTSSIILNGLAIPFSFSLEEYEHKRARLQIPNYTFEYKDFARAMPAHLFRVIPHLDMTGKINFSLLLDCDFADPEGLLFDFELASKSLHFSDSARYFFTRYNQDFHYEYKEHGEVMKDIWVSPANKDFVPHNDIPFYLKYAILVAEDPSFFRHDGFLKSAMKESMALNLERGKFARGGSTLSMQLVKNLFLTKKKTLSRKVEEVFLVWLIEDNRLISKDRMFEIYINIIEWAPNVYGLGEASRFYFNTSPDRLTFGECVFLATLIRSPKHYARYLDAEGYPTHERREEMHLIARRMLERGLINETQYSTFNSYIQTEIVDIQPAHD